MPQFQIIDSDQIRTTLYINTRKMWD